MRIHTWVWRKLCQVRSWVNSSSRLGLPWEAPSAVCRLIQLVQPYTMIEPLRLAMLYGLAREVLSEGIEGDIVECGVCNGGSAALMAAAITSDPTRRLWLYDTFAGIPAPGSRDGPLAPQYEGQLRGSLERVQEVFQKVRVPLSSVVIRQGLFQDTFAEPLPDRVALLHVDADWYQSVIDSLRTFYPLVTDGGLIVLDDFGHWEGAREAFYDFCREQGINPLLERTGYTQAFWRKGQTQARDRRSRYPSGVYRPRFED